VNGRVLDDSRLRHALYEPVRICQPPCRSGRYWHRNGPAGCASGLALNKASGQTSKPVVPTAPLIPIFLCWNSHPMIIHPGLRPLRASAPDRHCLWQRPYSVSGLLHPCRGILADVSVDRIASDPLQPVPNCKISN